MERTLKTQSGASLIEICITIVIISIAVLIISTFSKSTLRMNKDTLSVDTAYLAAEEKITELRSETFDQFPVTSSDNVTLENINFTRDWTIEESGYLSIATVTVSWNSQNNTRQITLAGPVN